MNHEDAKETPYRMEEVHADEVLTWCFLSKDGRIRKPLADGTRPLLRAADIVNLGNPVAMLHAHLHPCERVIDALRFSRCLYICRARLSGRILSKQYAMKGPTATIIASYADTLEILWATDATRILSHFVLDLAERALSLWAGGIPTREPESRFMANIALNRIRLEREVSDNEYAQMHFHWSDTIRPIWEKARASGHRWPLNSPYLWVIVTSAASELMSIYPFHPVKSALKAAAALSTSAEDIQLMSLAELNAELERRLTGAFGGIETE